MGAPSRSRRANSSSSKTAYFTMPLFSSFSYFFYRLSRRQYPDTISLRTCPLFRGWEPAEQSQMLANHQLPPARPREMKRRSSEARSPASSPQPTSAPHCWARTQKTRPYNDSNTRVHAGSKQPTGPGISHIVADSRNAHVSPAASAPCSSFLPRPPVELVPTSWAHVKPMEVLMSLFRLRAQSP